LRWEKMRRWTSPAWKERQPVLTENDNARGKKAAERRDWRWCGGRPWACCGLTMGLRHHCPMGARRPGPLVRRRGPLARRRRGGGRTGRAAEWPFFTEEGVGRKSGGLLFYSMGNGFGAPRGLAAAKMPATLLRRKSTAGWFRGDGVP
jgi:hypothetical protein